jgi:hypothetical protein
VGFQIKVVGFSLKFLMLLTRIELGLSTHSAVKTLRLIITMISRLYVHSIVWLTQPKSLVILLKDG